jgi:hypothetical protein
MVADIPINLNTEIQNYVTKITGQIKNLSSIYDKAAKGMDIDEALTLSSKLKIGLNELTFKDGKFFYNNTEKLTQAYINYQENLLSEIQSRYIKLIGDSASDINTEGYLDK